MPTKITSRTQNSNVKPNNNNDDVDEDNTSITNNPQEQKNNSIDSSSLNDGIDQSGKPKNRNPVSISNQDDKSPNETEREAEDSSSTITQSDQAEPPRRSFRPYWIDESPYGRPEPISSGTSGNSEIPNSSGSESPGQREIKVQIKGTAIEQGASYVVLNKEEQEIARGVDGEDGGEADGVINFSTDESQIEKLRVGIDNNRAHDFFLSISPSTSSVSSEGDGTRDGSENTKEPTATMDFKKENGILGINANMSKDQVDYFNKIVDGNLVGNYASNPADPQNKILERKLLNGTASQLEVSNLLENVNDVRQHKISGAREALKRTLLNLDMVNSMGFEYPQSGDDPSKMAAMVRSNVAKIIDRTDTLALNVHSFNQAVAEAYEYGVDSETLNNELSKNLDLPINSNSPQGKKVSLNSLYDVKNHVYDKVGNNLDNFKKQLDILQINESKTLSAKEAKDQQETIDLTVNALMGVMSIGEIVGTSAIAATKLSTASSKLDLTDKLRGTALKEARGTAIPASIKKLDDGLAAKKVDLKNIDEQFDALIGKAGTTPEKLNLVRKSNEMALEISALEQRNAGIKNLFNQLKSVEGPNKKQISEMLDFMHNGDIDITPFWKVVTSGPGRIFDGKALDIAKLDTALANFKNIKPLMSTGTSVDKSLNSYIKSNTPGAPVDELTFSASIKADVRSAIENLPEYKELKNTLKPMVLRGYAEQSYPPLTGSDYAERQQPILGSSSAGYTTNLQVSLPPSVRFVEKVDQNMKRAAELNAELLKNGNNTSRNLVVDERFLRTSFNAFNGARPTFETRIIRVDNWIFGSEDKTVRIGNNPEVFDKYRGTNTHNVEWTPELSRQYYRYPSSQNIIEGWAGDEFSANQPFPWLA